MPTTGSMTENSAQVAEFLSWFRVTRGRAPLSCATYRWTLTTWVDHLGATSFRTAGPEHVESFLLRPLPRAGTVGAPATRRQNIAVLASFYKWLCAMDPSCRNPTALVGVPKVNNRKPRALDDDVWRCVWRHALPVERAWLGLGFFTGLRPGELARLSAGHFRPESKEIVGFVRKGGNEGHVMCSQMAHLFHSRMPRLLPSVDDWLGPLSGLAVNRDPGESLIPWHSGEPRHTAQTMERYGLMPGEVAPVVPARRLKVILRRSNLHPNLFTPHALRHSFVGNTLAMGVPLHIVQRLADHASPGTTMRYGRSTQSMLDDWMG